MFSKFAESESGAVSVDWVVLTAIVVGLGVAVTVPAYMGFTGAATSLASSLVLRVNTAPQH